MPLSLYFSGRAINQKEATAFVADIRQTASNLGVAFVEHPTASLAIHFETGADDLVIEFNEALILDGSIKLSEDREDKDLRNIAVLFASAYELLDVFELADDDGRVLLAHGDVESLEAYLEEEIRAEEKDNSSSAAAPVLGKLDTQWYSHARVLGGHTLEVSAQARARIDDVQWEMLRTGISGLKGIEKVALEPGTSSFDFLMSTEPTPEECKRVAIAVSFMIDDAIENSAA